MAQRSDEQALYFYGVTRSRGWRAGKNGEQEFVRVSFRDLDAVAVPIEFELPQLTAEKVAQHHGVVEQIMQRTTLVPAPFGVVFRSKRALIKFMQDEYLVLDEALAFVDDHCELRMVVTARTPAETRRDLDELAAHVYSELRRSARAAVPFPREQDKLMSAAFLVERNAAVEFAERARDLAGKDLTVEVSAPFAPYDFVRFAEKTESTDEKAE